jgi:hypothetical protein
MTDLPRRDTDRPRDAADGILGYTPLSPPPSRSAGAGKTAAEIARDILAEHGFEAGPQRSIDLGADLYKIFNARGRRLGDAQVVHMNTGDVLGISLRDLIARAEAGELRLPDPNAAVEITLPNGRRVLARKRDVGMPTSLPRRREPFEVDEHPWVPPGQAFLIDYSKFEFPVLELDDAARRHATAFDLASYQLAYRFGFPTPWEWERDPFYDKPPRGLRNALRWTWESLCFHWRLHTGRRRRIYKQLPGIMPISVRHD